MRANRVSHSAIFTSRVARRKPNATFHPGVGAATQSEHFAAFLAAISASSHRSPNSSSSPRTGTLPLSSSPAAITSLLTSFSRAGLFSDALRLFLSLKSPTAFHYNTLIHSLAASNHPSAALRLFDCMLAHGVAPSPASFSILVKIQSFYLNDVDSAYEVIRSMVRFGIGPDSITYSTLIAGLCRFGRIQEAWGVLDVMLEENCTPSINTYTSILRAYCSEGRMEEAKRLVCAMERFGFAPDTIIYSVLIEGLCKVGDFDEVERVLGDCDLKGWKPNEVTYNSYLNGLCKWGRVDEAFRQVQVMQSKGLRPDTVTLGILFDCLCRDDSNVWEAKCLLERSFKLGWDVDVFFYNMLMSRFCEIGNWTSALKLFADILKKGIEPDTCTFTSLIRSLCLAGRFKEAICVIHSKGVDADIVAFNTLIHWLAMEQMVYEIRIVFSMMKVQNVLPNKFTYSMMIDCLCRSGQFCEAIEYFLFSLKDEFFPDLADCLNYWLVKGGKLKEMLRVFDEILERGLVINGLLFNSTIKAFCRQGFCQSAEFYRVCLTLDKMLGIR